MNNNIDWIQKGSKKDITIKGFLFDNNFWNSKDRNIILFFIVIWIILFWLKIVFADTNEEIINWVKQEYNQIRKKYYDSDSEIVNKLNNEIGSLSLKRDIRKKCLDYNYAHYDTVLRPIDCNKIEKENLEVIKNWKVNSEGLSQQFIPIIASWVDERINELLLSYWRGEDVLENRWQRVALKYELKTSILVCIAKADSSLGKALKTSNNFGNVWNNDRWDKVHFASAIEWIEAIAKTLNNQYLGWYNQLKQLSRYWNKDWSIYASSTDNWHNNVINCLSSLYGETISDDFNFRN